MCQPGNAARFLNYSYCATSAAETVRATNVTAEEEKVGRARRIVSCGCKEIWMFAGISESDEPRQKALRGVHLLMRKWARAQRSYGMCISTFWFRLALRCPTVRFISKDQFYSAVVSISR